MCVHAYVALLLSCMKPVNLRLQDRTESKREKERVEGTESESEGCRKRESEKGKDEGERIAGLLQIMSLAFVNDRFL